MKITNKTHWDTKSIQKLIAEALKRDNKIEGKFPRRKDLEVEIVYCKKCLYRSLESFSGFAYYNSSYMKIRVPRKQIDPRKFARVFVHELTHSRGFKHNKMGGRFLKVDNLEEDNWALEYPIVPKVEKLKLAKPKVDLQLKRFEHVSKMLKDRKSKLKRLQNQIKNWTQKRKYYEHILAANGKIKKENSK